MNAPLARVRRPLPRYPTVMLATLFVALLAMSAYLHGPLAGRFDHFFLPAQAFGVPDQLKARGLTAMYGGRQLGWDGQFYYYMANDPLARADTPLHLDAPSYRYQRIGLSLLAWLAGMLTGQGWVSPLTYYLTSLCLVLLAATMAARHFEDRGMIAYGVLPWSLAFGTQVTQLNGLPDAAADALLILALLSLRHKHAWIYALAATFAALAREAYILVPACFAMALLLSPSRPRGRGLISGFLPHILPILVALGWQWFLRVRFGVSPASQAGGILDWPLHSWSAYLRDALAGRHPLVGNGRSAWAEAAGLAWFALLLVWSAIALYPLLKRRQDAFRFGFALTGYAFGALYLCFGPTVMMHHTGYLKAANLFLFLLPMAYLLREARMARAQVALLAAATAFGLLLLAHRATAVPKHEARASIADAIPTEPR